MRRAGNIANVQAAIDAVDEPALRGWAGPWNYATPRADRRAAARGGLHRRLDVAAAVAGRARDPHEYFTTVILGSHLERLPTDERSPFVDAVLSHLDDPVRANYVRLNILARR